MLLTSVNLFIGTGAINSIKKKKKNMFRFKLSYYSRLSQRKKKEKEGKKKRKKWEQYTPEMHKPWVYLSSFSLA